MVEETMERKIRILMGKPGLDCHDRACVVLCQAFRDAGMEVIYTGPYQTPESIAETAVEEDVDIVALSLLDGRHMSHFPRLVELLKKRNAEDICIVSGGRIPEKDKPLLEKIGITGNFGAGTPLDLIVEHINERVRRKREKEKQ